MFGAQTLAVPSFLPFELASEVSVRSMGLVVVEEMLTVVLCCEDHTTR